MFCCRKALDTIKILDWILSKAFDIAGSNIAAQNFKAVISCLSYWTEFCDKNF